MKTLDNQISTEIRGLIKKCAGDYKKGNFTQAIAYLESAWDLLPDSKVEYEDSFHIAKPLAELYLKTNNFDKAKKWSELLYKCDVERIDSGEREFLSGQISFEEEDMVAAKRFFLIAFEKSDGRRFEGKNSQYLKLISK